MNCVKCSTSIPEGKSFCPSCGHLQDAAKSSDDKSGFGLAYKRNFVTPVATLIGALLITTVIVLFAKQNAAIVTMSFYSFHFEGSLATVLDGVFVLGAFAGMLAGLFVSYLRS